MNAPSTNETAVIESNKRDNMTINVTYVNKFENLQAINLEFKVTNVTVNLNTTMNASDFIVRLNDYKMDFVNGSFFIQSTMKKSF